MKALPAEYDYEAARKDEDEPALYSDAFPAFAILNVWKDFGPRTNRYNLAAQRDCTRAVS